MTNQGEISLETLEELYSLLDEMESDAEEQMIQAGVKMAEMAAESNDMKYIMAADEFVTQKRRHFAGKRLAFHLSQVIKARQRKER